MPQQEKGDLPASLPTSTSIRVCKGACLGHSGSLSPMPTSPPGPLSCSCQAMARIMPMSVNQENVFFLEKHCGSAYRPPKTPAMQFARSLTYSNPETYVPGFRGRKKQTCHRQAQRHREAKHAALSHTVTMGTGPNPVL
uniref:Uncharacterized protein n=1 Tax=Myotis myotis TaxID=51298 RepID=A0A7J7TJM1_MYOMY|nr:hypothetical protein mMyoMyo1_009047 [Myotis myotis]